MGMSSRLLSRFLLRVATARDKCSVQDCFDRKGVRQCKHQKHSLRCTFDLESSGVC